MKHLPCGLRAGAVCMKLGRSHTKLLRQSMTIITLWILLTMNSQRRHAYGNWWTRCWHLLQVLQVCERNWLVLAGSTEFAYVYVWLAHLGGKKTYLCFLKFLFCSITKLCKTLCPTQKHVYEINMGFVHGKYSEKCCLNVLAIDYLSVLPPKQVFLFCLLRLFWSICITEKHQSISLFFLDKVTNSCCLSHFLCYNLIESWHST